jgi:selenocysteine lyase/cysteine desulfurase
MTALDRRSFLKTTAASLAVLPACRSTLSVADEDPLGVRADFPVAQSHTYLNTASVGPLSKVVRDAGVAYLDQNMTAPFAGGRDDEKDLARGLFAELFGAKKEEVAILYSTSDGENLVASGLDLKAGENIVIDELHFTTAFVLYRQLEKEKGIELRIVPDKEGRSRLEDFDSLIDDKTRLVSVAWVSNRNGYRQDVRALAEITHSKGGLLYADAVQAIGHGPVDLRAEGVDFMTANSYKWLFASFGAAPFFVCEEHLDRLRPDRYGHGSPAEFLPDHHFRLRDTAQKYEYATSSYGTIYQLRASLGHLKQVGLDRIEEHAGSLARELREGIADLGFEIWTPEGTRSPIVSFAHGRDTAEMKKRFEEEGIVVTFREEGGSVIRTAVALFNNRGDVQKLLSVLGRVA